MNLCIYHPDEEEKHDESGENPDILPFSHTLTQTPNEEHMSVTEVAQLLGRTEAEILDKISLSQLPAREIDGKWIIFRKYFDIFRPHINESFQDNSDEEEANPAVTPAE